MAKPGRPPGKIQSEILHMRTTPQFLRAVDKGRRQQDDKPTRSERSPNGRDWAEGEEMSAAETSAYLLMAGGLIWVLVGIAGLVRRRGDGLRTGRDRAEHEETGTDHSQ